MPPQYIVFIPAAPALIITLVGLCSRNRRIHGVLCIAWLFAASSYMFLSSLARVADRSINRLDELLPWSAAAELTRVPLAA